MWVYKTLYIYIHIIYSVGIGKLTNLFLYEEIYRFFLRLLRPTFMALFDQSIAMKVTQHVEYIIMFLYTENK